MGPSGGCCRFRSELASLPGPGAMVAHAAAAGLSSENDLSP